MSWLDRLIRWKEHLEESLLLPQQRAILHWIMQEGMLHSDERVVFSLGEEERFFLERGKWQKEHFVKSTAEIAFLVVLPGQRDYGLKNLTQRASSDDWCPLYRSTVLEVWENRARHQGKVLPLRFGLSVEEKRRVIRASRRILEAIYSGEEPNLPDLGERFLGKQTLDIAVWVDGHLRASMIEVGKPCTAALLDAARRVPHDARFESLLIQEELPRARIEITFMSSLEIPLTHQEKLQNETDPTKGYVVRSHGKTGWFLPEVHNAIQFKDLADFCLRLAQEKAKIDPTLVSYRDYRLYEVTDWVETEMDYLALSGSMPEPRKETLASDAIIQIGNHAVENLQKLQTPDGNIPAIFHPKKGGVKEPDWIRVACTAHALFSYGKATQNAGALMLAKSITRVADVVFQGGKLPIQQRWLFSVYRLRAQFASGETVQRKELEEALKSLSQYQNNPIPYLQGLSLFIEASVAGVFGEVSSVEEAANRMYSEWVVRRDLPTTQLAWYPELYAVLVHLWEKTHEEKWQEKCADMEGWFASKQLSDGSFPITPGRSFSYTRGTGKILEVLACCPEVNRRVLDRGLRWVETMQYRPENSFFIPIEYRESLIGGFRHDAFNPEAWIDASAHVLLGIARLIEFEKNKRQKSG